MTLIDLCCVLDTMLIKMLFIQRTKTTHTLQQVSTRFSMTDDPRHSILSPADLLAKAKTMLKDQLVTVFWRLRDTTGPPAPFVRANFIVDCPRKKIIKDPKDDEYVWLIPEDNHDDCEPFPQDGRHDCDEYEYSYVDVTGEPAEPEPEPPKKPARTRPSSVSQARGESERALDAVWPSPGVAPRRADTRLVAEDPAEWADVLHTGDRSLDIVNLRGLETYYSTTFGHLGVDATQKEMIALVIKTLSEDMEAVMTDPSFCTSQHWVKARCRSIHKLSMIRNAKVGYPKELVREMNQAYEETTIPEWQRVIHSEACQRVKITSWKPDTRVTPSHGGDGHGDLSEEPPEPKGVNGGAKGKPGSQYGGYADKKAQSAAGKKAAADKKAAGAAFLASMKGKLSPAELAKLKDFC